MEFNLLNSLFVINVITFIVTLIYCRFLSIYDQTEFLGPNDIVLLLISLLLGPSCYVVYYIFALFMFGIRQIDRLIKYFAIELDKKRINKLLYSTWRMRGSGSNKYIIIGYKKEKYTGYMPFGLINYSDQYRKIAIYVERNGLLSNIDIDSIEMDTK